MNAPGGGEDTNTKYHVSVGGSPLHNGPVGGARSIKVFVPPESAQESPDVTASGLVNSEKLLTFIMYDVDAPYPQSLGIGTKSPLLHWAVGNAHFSRDGNRWQGDVLVPYIPPKPPVNSMPHRYVVIVYEQNPGSPPVPAPPPGFTRELFDIQRFEKDTGIEQLSTFAFLSGFCDRGGCVATTQSHAKPREQPRTQTEAQARAQEQPRTRMQAQARTIPVLEGGSYFLPDVPLDEKQQAYCRCVLHVAAKRSSGEGKRKPPYNPYAICTKSVGRQSPCSRWYNFDAIPDNELIGYAQLRHLEIPSPYDRNILLRAIASYLCRKGDEDIRKNPICSLINAD